MVIQYLSKVEIDGKKQTIETIEDGVDCVRIYDTEIEAVVRKNGNVCTTTYRKDHPQIYQMWLLNDQFRTLKRLMG